MINPNTNLNEIEGVGEKTTAILKKLGLNTVSDLLFFIPFRYELYSEENDVENFKIGESVKISCVIDLIESRRAIKNKMWITESILVSNEKSFKAIWFNQPYISKVLKVGDSIILKGKVSEKNGQLVIISPDYEKIQTEKIENNTSNISPIYHLTSGNLSQKQLRSIIKRVIKTAEKINEWLPIKVTSTLGLTTLPKAIYKIHFPKNDKDIEEAKKRLFFSGLFLRQLKFQLIKNFLNNKKSAPIEFKEKESKKFVSSLPFKLTDSQRKSAWEILKDLEKNKPMSRLLEGDVGSGKTVVVSIAILNTILNKKRVALMVPSEILAVQHFKTMTNFFKDFKIKIAIKTSSYEKGDWKKSDLIIGTQSLIQKDFFLENLGLIIIDEQHRFGVNQRKKIIDLNKQKNEIPHFLSLSATPIPRSLSLAIYGDLDISLIDEMPIGRKKTITKLMKDGDRESVYHFVKQKLAKKEQCFIVYPLISPSNKLSFKSASEEYKNISEKHFKDFKTGIIHGKLKKEEKEKIMLSFSKGEIDVLVATTVIEVGIDIPKATTIIIEGADRFGLSQLHQLRGRVNRSDLDSYCFLFPSEDEIRNQKTINRLKSLEKFHRGLDLAKIDLKLRGSGQIFGSYQSGFFDLNNLSIFDYQFIKKSRDLANEIVKKDNNLKSLPLIKEKLEKLKDDVHLE